MYSISRFISSTTNIDGVAAESFDKIKSMDFKKILDSLALELFDFAKLAVLAFIVYFIGKKLIKWVLRLLTESFHRSNMDMGVASFLTAVIRTALYLLLFVAIISIFGFDKSSLVALVGSAGLTIGLALQGSLSNFAGGVLILIMKPFRIGDYIITSGNEGTVTGIDIFYTRLLTGDNRLVVIPNGTLSNSSITNVTNEAERRLDLTVSIDYSEDIRRVKQILSDIASRHELIIAEKDISIFVNSFDPSAITIGLRVWTMKENYWTLKWELLEFIKIAFDENDITIPFDQLDVNINEKK